MPILPGSFVVAKLLKVFRNCCQQESTVYLKQHMYELVVQFPARGSIPVLLCLFPGVLWLWRFLYSVGPHPVLSLHIFTFIVSRAFMAVAASQAGDADSSRAPGLTSGLQVSVNIHRGALLLVPEWQCISSFVFYICMTIIRMHTTPKLVGRNLHKTKSHHKSICYMHDKGRISPWHGLNYLNSW